MMENWVADSKRGPLQHAPEGSAATLNKRRVRRCDKRHPATHWETPERVAHTTLPPRRDMVVLCATCHTPHTTHSQNALLSETSSSTCSATTKPSWSYAGGGVFDST